MRWKLVELKRFGAWDGGGRSICVADIGLVVPLWLSLVGNNSILPIILWLFSDYLDVVSRPCLLLFPAFGHDMNLCSIFGNLEFVDLYNFVACRGLRHQHPAIQLFFFWALNGII